MASLLFTVRAHPTETSETGAKEYDLVSGIFLVDQL